MSAIPHVFASLRRTARPRRNAQAFTLLEVLVVIVIIGVIVSMATLSVGVLGRDRQVEDQATRMWAVLRQAKEETELQSMNLGIFVSSEAYEFLRFDPRQNLWIPISDDKLYATRRLPEGLRLRLWLDSREVILKPDLPKRMDDEDEDEEPTEEEKEEAELPEALRTINRDKPPKTQEDPPQIVILSSGEIMPFELQIERERAPALWRLQALADNDLRVERRDEDNRQEWFVVSQTRPPVDERQEQANARK